METKYIFTHPLPFFLTQVTNKITSCNQVLFLPQVENKENAFVRTENINSLVTFLMPFFRFIALTSKKTV